MQKYFQYLYKVQIYNIQYFKTNTNIQTLDVRAVESLQEKRVFRKGSFRKGFRSVSKSDF